MEWGRKEVVENFECVVEAVLGGFDVLDAQSMAWEACG